MRCNPSLVQKLALWLIIWWIIMAIAPFDRFDWLLENLLFFIFSAILVALFRRDIFTNTSYILITIFFTLHLMGAHYTYAETPLGYWIQELTGASRNHYDRITHFSFGLLLAFPLRELFMVEAGIKRSWSYWNAIIVITAMSGFYEVIEGIVAVIVSPELGAAYLGTQGDIWDAQKDSLLAVLGACVGMLVNWLWDRHRLKLLTKY